MSNYSSSSSFVAHLVKACAKPVNMPVFLDGYAMVREGVSRPGIFTLHGLTVEAPAGVYSPHETSSTRFVMDHFGAAGLELPPSGGRLLEVGCGAGAISLLAARLGWSVVASDIDPVAVAAAAANATANDLALEAKVSDLFAGVADEKFDVIVFNQPFFHQERPIDEDERTLSDFGGQLYVRFMRDSLQHLKQGGYVLVAYSNCSNVELLDQPGWDLELRAFDFDGASDYIRALFRATPSTKA